MCRGRFLSQFSESRRSRKKFDHAEVVKGIDLEGSSHSPLVRIMPYRQFCHDKDSRPADGLLDFRSL